MLFIILAIILNGLGWYVGVTFSTHFRPRGLYAFVSRDLSLPRWYVGITFCTRSCEDFWKDDSPRNLKKNGGVSRSSYGECLVQVLGEHSVSSRLAMRILELWKQGSTKVSKMNMRLGTNDYTNSKMDAQKPY